MIIIAQPRRLLNLKHDGSQSKVSSTMTRSRHVLGERFLKLGIKDPAGLYSGTTMSRSRFWFDEGGANSPEPVYQPNKFTQGQLGYFLP